MTLTHGFDRATYSLFVAVNKQIISNEDSCDSLRLYCHHERSFEHRLALLRNKLYSVHPSLWCFRIIKIVAGCDGEGRSTVHIRHYSACGSSLIKDVVYIEL